MSDSPKKEVILEKDTSSVLLNNPDSNKGLEPLLESVLLKDPFLKKTLKDEYLKLSEKQLRSFSQLPLMHKHQDGQKQRENLLKQEVANELLASATKSFFLKNAFLAGPRLFKYRVNFLGLNQSWFERYSSGVECAVQPGIAVSTSIGCIIGFVLHALSACLNAIIALGKALIGLCVLPFDKNKGKQCLSDVLTCGTEVLFCLSHVVFDVLSLVLVPAAVLARAATRGMATLFSFGKKEDLKPLGGVQNDSQALVGITEAAAVLLATRAM